VLAAARWQGAAAAGEREIEIDRIVGSAGSNRARDFDPAFLPISRRQRGRWSAIYAALLRGETVPAIDVYQVGGDYYVIDGHHRVSAAARLGRTRINARVIEVKTRVPIEPGADTGTLLRAAEYAAFLDVTGLDRVRPDARLECSRLGRYDELVAHVLGHRYFLGLEQGAEVPMEQAAASWYDNVYLPVMRAVRVHGLLARFPQLTEADLYVEVTRRWLEQAEAGTAAGPHEAAHRLLLTPARRWWRRRRSLTLG
jgi:ParB/Sulfiredoxin domain